MSSTVSNRQAQQSRNRRPRKNQKEGQRNLDYGDQAINEAIFRLTQSADGRILFRYLEHKVATFKTTENTKTITPNTNACIWLAAWQNLLNHLNGCAEKGSGKYNQNETKPERDNYYNARDKEEDDYYDYDE